MEDRDLTGKLICAAVLGFLFGTSLYALFGFTIAETPDTALRRNIIQTIGFLIGGLLGGWIGWNIRSEWLKFDTQVWFGSRLLESLFSSWK